MKIDLTEHEFDSLIATLIGTIAEYKESFKKFIKNITEELDELS